MNHLAVLHAPYLDAILDGRKSVESRFSVTRRAPYGVVATGDVVILKQRSGPVRAAADVSRVEFFEGLTPGRIRALRRRLGALVAAPGDYWESRAHAAFATFLWFSNLRRVVPPPEVPPLYGRGWLVLERSPGSGASSGARSSPRRAVSEALIGREGRCD